MTEKIKKAAELCLADLARKLEEHEATMHSLIGEQTGSESVFGELQKQKGEIAYLQGYLENLMEELCEEVDNMQRDVRLQAQRLDDLDSRLDDIERKGSRPSKEDNIDESRRPSYHPLLSSIPPRQLSEDEARRLLRAIDDIASQKVSPVPPAQAVRK